MKEFTVSSGMEKIQFKVGDDLFVAVAPDRLPGNVLIRYAEKAQAGKLYEGNLEFFNYALEDESAALFKNRLDSKDNPITLDVMTQVVEWLVEQYANLNTQVS